MPLIVLIWGPGVSGGDLYEKRLQVRGILRSNGYGAVLSEEIDAECGESNASSKGRELLQALNADFVIIIYGSPGSIAETHDFAGLQEIGHKMLILIDSQHTKGYGFQGALAELNQIYNNVHTYEHPNEITEYALITKILGRLANFRWTKWQAQHIRRTS